MWANFTTYMAKKQLFFGIICKIPISRTYLQVKSQSQAQVISITTKEKAKERPIALNTVELMRVASSGLGMGPHHAMQIAEKLYTQGYISYPRTESTQYAENFDLKDVLRQHQNASDWGQDVKELLAKGKISFTFQTLHKERGFL